MNSDWAVVLVTLILALLAGWYSFETRRIVQRMDREREASSFPRLALHVVSWQPKLIKLRLQNIGVGPALAITGSISAKDKTRSEISIPWNYSLLMPGQFEEFGVPARQTDGAKEHARLFSLDDIRDQIESVTASFRYTSSLGREYSMADSIDVTSLTDSWIASEMMATQDHPDRLLPRIARTLEGIEKALRR